MSLDPFATIRDAWQRGDRRYRDREYVAPGKLEFFVARHPIVVYGAMALAYAALAGLLRTWAFLAVSVGTSVAGIVRRRGLEWKALSPQVRTPVACDARRSRDRAAP